MILIILSKFSFRNKINLVIFLGRGGEAWGFVQPIASFSTFRCTWYDFGDVSQNTIRSTQITPLKGVTASRSGG
jgi:hypothetical protein